MVQEVKKFVQDKVGKKVKGQKNEANLAEMEGQDQSKDMMVQREHVIVT